MPIPSNLLTTLTAVVVSWRQCVSPIRSSNMPPTLALTFHNGESFLALSWAGAGVSKCTPRFLGGGWPPLTVETDEIELPSSRMVLRPPIHPKTSSRYCTLRFTWSGSVEISTLARFGDLTKEIEMSPEDA